MMGGALRKLVLACAALTFVILIAAASYAAGRHNVSSNPMNLVYTINPPRGGHAKSSKSPFPGYKIYIWTDPYPTPAPPPNGKPVKQFAGDSVDIEGKDEDLKPHPHNHVPHKAYVKIYSI